MIWRLSEMTKTISFEILALYCAQEAGKSKRQTEGGIAAVGKQEILTCSGWQLTKCDERDGELIHGYWKEGYVGLMGTTERGGQKDSSEKEERRNTKNAL